MNPFSVLSPESQSAQDVVGLFVENSPGADSIQTDGHAMLVGPRGAGKSMLLRYMEPDCQRIVHREADEPRTLADLPYYAGYMTIRETELSLPALSLVESSHSNYPLNEHLLVLTIALSILTRADRNNHFGHASVSDGGAYDALLALRRTHDREADSSVGRWASEQDLIKGLSNWLLAEHEYAVDYFTKLASHQTPAFDRRLFRFAGFLSPLINALKLLPSMPSSRRFFLLIDDADQLSEVQTRILNTWLSRRNSTFGIKVSYEMYGYKTFYTVMDTRIEAPHDYQEIRVSDIYTSNKKLNYRDRMRIMIARRLSRANIVRGNNLIPDVDNFFPEDGRQSLAFETLRMSKKQQLQRIGGRSSRIRDDLYRYVLPEYMSALGGNRKSRSTYKYCGFEQLVDISSGVPRYFLEAAAKMYDRQLLTAPNVPNAVRSITPEVQDSVVRDLAAELYMGELEKLWMDPKNAASPAVSRGLHNLIGSLGAFFEKQMNDVKASERRVFSFALSDEVSSDVDDVLRLGLRHSYFSRSSIGRKEGFGRTDRYVLSRRFAPHWNLDPSGFSAYKFITNADLEEMIARPDQFRKRLRRGEVLAGDVGEQLPLPIDEE